MNVNKPICTSGGQDRLFGGDQESLQKGGGEKVCQTMFFQKSSSWVVVVVVEFNARSKVRHHPDKHNDASEEEKAEHERKFKDIAEAFSVLSDTKLR